MHHGIPRRWLPCTVGYRRRWLPCSAGYRGGGASPWGGADRGGAATERRGTSPRPTARIWLRVVLYGIMYRFHTQNADSGVHTRSDAPSNMHSSTHARTHARAHTETNAHATTVTHAASGTHTRLPLPRRHARARACARACSTGAEHFVAFLPHAIGAPQRPALIMRRARHTLDLRRR